MKMELQRKRCVVCLSYLPNCQNVNVSEAEDLFDDEKIQKDNCKTLKDQLPVIFLLRKLLEIPVDVCTQFLQDYGNPCSWVNYCSSCSKLLDNARHVFDQMTLLQERFKMLQAELKNAVFVSINSPENAFCDDLDEGSEIVRLYVNNCYQNFEFSTTPEPLNYQPPKGNSGNCDTLEKSDRLKNANCSDGFYMSETVFVDVKNSDPKIVEKAVTLNPLSGTTATSKNSERHACYACKAVYSTADFLMEHVKTHIGRRENMCQFCGKSFSSPISLILHVKRHPGKTSFKCDHCSKDFLTSELLIAHVKSHQVQVEETRGLETFDDLKSHDKSQALKNQFVCQKCGNVFENGLNLRNHLAVHDTPHQCKSCGKEFKYRRSLRRHYNATGPCYRLVSLLNETHKCGKCGNSYSHSHSLTRHINNSCRERNVCKFCGKGFGAKRELTDHMVKTHSDKPGISLHECQLCGKEFAQQRYLKRHIKVVHKESEFQNNLDSSPSFQEILTFENGLTFENDLTVEDNLTFENNDLIVEDNLTFEDKNLTFANNVAFEDIVSFENNVTIENNQTFENKHSLLNPAVVNLKNEEVKIEEPFVLL